jgi:hypothetical protein
MDGSPHRLEYTNLRGMNPAGIGVQQFDFEKVYAIQSLADTNRQIAMHSPAAAQAAINLCTETNVAVHNLHRRLLFSRT